MDNKWKLWINYKSFRYTSKFNSKSELIDFLKTEKNLNYILEFEVTNPSGIVEYYFGHPNFDKLKENE